MVLGFAVGVGMVVNVVGAGGRDMLLMVMVVLLWLIVMYSEVRSLLW